MLEVHEAVEGDQCVVDEAEPEEHQEEEVVSHPVVVEVAVVSQGVAVVVSHQEDVVEPLVDSRVDEVRGSCWKWCYVCVDTRRYGFAWLSWTNLWIFRYQDCKQNRLGNGSNLLTCVCAVTQEVCSFVLYCV